MLAALTVFQISSGYFNSLLIERITHHTLSMKSNREAEMLVFKGSLHVLIDSAISVVQGFNIEFTISVFRRMFLGFGSFRAKACCNHYSFSGL